MKTLNLIDSGYCARLARHQSVNFRKLIDRMRDGTASDCVVVLSHPEESCQEKLAATWRAAGAEVASRPWKMVADQQTLWDSIGRKNPTSNSMSSAIAAEIISRKLRKGDKLSLFTDDFQCFSVCEALDSQDIEVDVLQMTSFPCDPRWNWKLPGNINLVDMDVHEICFDSNGGFGSFSEAG